LPDSPASTSAGWREQPHAIVERDGVRYTLLGTAHVSHASVQAVREAIGSGAFDAVAVELDEQRLKAMGDPDALAKLDLVKVLREGKTPMFAANLALASYQRRLAEQLGIEPGAELKAAVEDAQARGLPMHLVDRDVGLTFRRALQGLGWWQRAKLAGGILAGLIADEELAEHDIEKLKQGDMLQASFSEFAEQTPGLYRALIAERDRYMAARLRQVPSGSREVLAVVGAGHLAGLARHLAEDTGSPTVIRARLEDAPPPRGMRWIGTAITLLILAMIVWGFWQGGADLGRQLVLEWAVITAVGAAVGTILAAGHPLGVVAAAIAAPLKPFRPPGVSPGLFSALVEAHVRKPAYGDFLALRDDAGSLRGWYRNRVSRTLLNFILTNLGSSAGVWVAGLRIAGQLMA